MASRSANRRRYRRRNLACSYSICILAFYANATLAQTGGGDLDADCNENGVPDFADVGVSWSPDCDSNGIPDECQIRIASSAPGGPYYCLQRCSRDCNINGVPDQCELVENDCDENGVPDACQVEGQLIGYNHRDLSLTHLSPIGEGRIGVSWDGGSEEAFITAIADDTLDGFLYAAGTTLGGIDVLLVVDPDTGDTFVIGPTGDGVPIRALATRTGDSGELLALRGSELIGIDPKTGNTKTIGFASENDSDLTFDMVRQKLMVLRSGGYVLSIDLDTLAFEFLDLGQTLSGLAFRPSDGTLLATSAEGLLSIDFEARAAENLGPIDSCAVSDSGSWGYNSRDGNLYACGYVDGELVRLDPRSRVARPVRRASGGADAIAYESAGDVLWGYDSARFALQRRDLSTGHLELVWDDCYGQYQDLAYDPDTQILYGILNGGQVDAIDTMTGNTTIISDLDHSRWGGLAFDPEHGLLFAYSVWPEHVLVKIDPFHGAVTEVGPFGPGEFRSLSIDPATNALVGVAYRSTGVPVAGYYLVEFDRTTGAATPYLEETRLVRSTLEFDDSTGAVFLDFTGTRYEVRESGLVGPESVPTLESAFGWEYEPRSKRLVGIARSGDAVLYRDLQNEFSWRWIDSEIPIAPFTFAPMRQAILTWHRSDAGSTIRWLDIRTGEVATIGQFGDELHPMAIQFDPGSESLVAAVATGEPEARRGALLNIDLDTGIATPLCDLPFQVRDLAIDPVTGDLLSLPTPETSLGSAYRLDLTSCDAEPVVLANYANVLSFTAVHDDCDGNGIVDQCEMAAGDCNGNGLLDRCELLAGAVPDLDDDGTPDDCQDFAFGDADGNGIVDAADFHHLWTCPRGPQSRPFPPLASALMKDDCLRLMDADADGDVDLRDSAALFAAMASAP